MFAYSILILLFIAFFGRKCHCFTACVTGGTGYLGSELVSQLLEDGHTVHTTVRSSNKPLVSYLNSLVKRFSEDRIKIFEADLLEEESFEKAVEGCAYVFHTAGPFSRDFTDSEEEIVEPLLFGMTNVFESAIQAGSIEKFILTSSTAALRGPDDKPSNGQFFTEEDWNTGSKRDGPGMQPYQWSKTVAEKGALNMGRLQEVPVATIVPSFMLGPPRSEHVDGVSVRTMREWARTGMPPPESKLIADVRDVARAHILAATTDSVVGRIIVSSEFRVQPKKIKDMDGYVLDTNGTKEVDCTRLHKELNMRLRPLEQTIEDFFACSVLNKAIQNERFPLSHTEP